MVIRWINFIFVLYKFLNTFISNLAVFISRVCRFERWRYQASRPSDYLRLVGHYAESRSITFVVGIVRERGLITIRYDYNNNLCQIIPILLRSSFIHIFLKDTGGAFK